MRTFKGYERAGGMAGIRNYVLVMSLVSCSNAMAEKIAAKTGAIAITHDRGCEEFEQEHSRTMLGLVSAARNPNVGAVLLVGLGCEQISLEEMRTALETSGKPVEGILIQQEGGWARTEAKGIEIVERFKELLSGQERVDCPLSHIVMGVQCGGSDWTTAIAGNTAIGRVSDLVVQNGGTVLMAEVVGFPGSEAFLAERAVSGEVALKILDMVSDLQRDFRERYGQSIDEVNPTPGNKAGGITTLAEKSMGNVRKTGTSRIQGVLRIGDPVPGPGLWIVDQRTPGTDPFNLTAMAMQMANVALFSSGRGSPVGNAVMPVIKITGNPETFRRLEDIFDFDAGGILDGETVERTGDLLFQALLETTGGKPTRSEINGNFEYAIPREQGTNFTCRK